LSKNAPFHASSSKEGFPIFPAGSSHFLHSFILGFFRLTQRRTPNTEEEEEDRRKRRKGGEEGRRKRRRQGGDEDGSKGISHHLRTFEEKWLKTVQNNTDSSPQNGGRQPKQQQFITTHENTFITSHHLAPSICLLPSQQIPSSKCPLK
jgi:hypothetical protein